MGEPARLPDFRRLADMVAEGTGQHLDEADRVDQFLGRLAREEVGVHSRAAKALSTVDLTPTELHRQLLRCFGNDDEVRIVTTNFDLLFEGAASEVPSRPLETYRAPALPMGTEFDGIVHLHGSVKRPDQMILTEADFGRAYLTERWSPRFLVDLFRSYTVLFVGYSHDDIVMSFLASALRDVAAERAGAPERFALTDEPAQERWADLGILPITYENTDGRHSGLLDGITGLANHVQRDLIGWQRTIGDVAQGLPPIDFEQADLLDDAVRDPERVKFFTSTAVQVEWIQWLEERGHLDKLFDQRRGNDGDAGRLGHLAWWLCHRFARTAADELLSLFERHALRMNQELWVALASCLGSMDEQAREVQEWKADVVAKWISLLLQAMPDSTPVMEFHLPGLAQAAARADLNECLLQVFEAMSRPRVPTHLAISGNDALTSRPSALGSVWLHHLSPRLDQIAERLLCVTSRRLGERHDLLCRWQGAKREHDRDTWRRTDVACSDRPNRYERSIDVLIDAACDSLEYLARHRPRISDGYIDQLVRAHAPLLRRIAIHAMTNRADRTPDEKIQWLLDEIGLYDPACERESVSLLEQTYSDASEEQRMLVLAAVEDRPGAPMTSENRYE